MAENPIIQQPGTFPFMQLPFEIRRLIYKNLLVTSCTQPGVPHKRNSRYKGVQHDKFPSVQILRVSKTINTEAIPILYAYNTFTNVSIKPNDDLYDILDEYGARDCESGKPDWATFHLELVDAVGKIFNVDSKELPLWLLDLNDLCDCTFQDTEDWVNDSAHTRRDYDVSDYEDGAGFDFPRFLRQIGQSNAARIRTVQFTFGDLPRAADHLPLYAEILKQHVAGVQKLIIDFDAVNDYGSHMEWEELEEHTLSAVEDLFGRLRQLLKDLPNLKNLAFTSCLDKYNEMAYALVQGERDSDTFDIRKMWMKLEDEANSKVNGAGFPCTCVRQSCFLTAPADRFSLYRSEEKWYEIWKCTWEETWYKGI